MSITNSCINNDPINGLIMMIKPSYNNEYDYCEIVRLP